MFKFKLNHVCLNGSKDQSGFYSEDLFWVFQGLMRELELREKKINDIQALGDKLVRDGHPGKQTVEVSWLCSGHELRRQPGVKTFIILPH